MCAVADLRLVSPTSPSASEIISSAKRRTPNQKRSFAGIRSLFTRREKRRAKKHQSAYRPTYDKVDNGPACRIYGSVEVKKVTANLHITTLGHGYMSFEHTDHTRTSGLVERAKQLVMNLTHVVHEFSFGPYFPAISQPLDMSIETTLQRTSHLGSRC
jgi:hypothetical protein